MNLASTCYTLQFILSTFTCLPDEKPASSAAVAINLKRHYEEDSSSEEEQER